MSWFYRNVVRPVLFSQDSEKIHQRTLRTLNFASGNSLLREAIASFFPTPSLSSEVFGLKFQNPVGLAAGMDKFAEAVPIWPTFGFGFTELGGVTWHPQSGNDKPRLFRVPKDGALINRMGFNNPGAEAFAEKLAEWREKALWPAHPVGINLGKSKITPMENAAEDYANSFRVLREFSDFVVVNVSSPNTPGLRTLQDKSALDEILAAIQEINRQSAKPILVKVSPDLSFAALDEILELAVSRSLAGIVATNTTTMRPDGGDKIYSETGGLSGRPLRQPSTAVIRHLFRQSKGSLPIIGVGGVFNADDAWEKISAGASLIQIYTGLIYEGPGISKDIVTGLSTRLKADGFKTLHDAVGHSAG